MKKLIILFMICSSILFAKEHTKYTYAYVTHSKPIYEYQYDRVYEECNEDDYYETYYEEPRYEKRRYDNNQIGVDTLVGATIGVAIGNQIGKGNGRDVARVVGGLLGAKIANNTRYQRDYNDYYDDRRVVKKRYRHCEDRVYTNRKTRVLTGYKNYFTVKGREYYKVTKRPVDRIRVTHIIRY